MKINGQNFMTISTSTYWFYSCLDIKRMVCYVCAVVGLQYSFTQQCLKLSMQPLCMEWQTFPTVIRSLSAAHFDSLISLLLPLAVVSINDVICVCGQLSKPLK